MGEMQGGWYIRVPARMTGAFRSRGQPFCWSGLGTSIIYPASSGRQLLIGARQSMPSSSIATADIDTVPVAEIGHTNRPFSSRFANRQRPWPSHHNSLIKSPRLPRKANSAPECGSCIKTSCTMTAGPSKPRRMSVEPQARQTRPCVGNAIIERPTHRERMSAKRRRPLREPAHARRSEARSRSRHSDRQTSRTHLATTATMTLSRLVAARAFRTLAQVRPSQIGRPIWDDTSDNSSSGMFFFLLAGSPSFWFSPTPGRWITAF